MLLSRLSLSPYLSFAFFAISHRCLLVLLQVLFIGMLHVSNELQQPGRVSAVKAWMSGAAGGDSGNLTFPSMAAGVSAASQLEL